jgi:tetratricopeptide (TPR) repeat protein
VTNDDEARAGEDVLARAAREIRASPELAALVPLSDVERARIADAAIDRAMRRRLPVRWIAGAGAVLAAAVVILYLRGARPAPLPRYAMVVAGEQATRGATHQAGPVALRPGTRLAITLTPAAPERDALVRLVLVRAGRATLLEPAITRGRGGAIEIAGAAGELVGAQSDGAGELVVVLGRALPGDAEVRAIATGGDAGAGLQVLRQAIVLEGFSHGSVETLLGGCRAVISPRRCELADAALHLWVAAPAEVALDGAPLGSSDGTRFVIPARPGALTVRVAGAEVATWQLTAPAASVVRASDEARAAGRLAEAEAALDRVVATSPGDQLEVVRRRAKLARLRGDVEGERAWRDRAVALARGLGRISVESDETAAIAYGLMDRHAFAAAARLLPALDAHGTLYAEGAVRRDYVRGVLASELGDLGAALAAFQRALAIADRIDDGIDRAAILGPLADVLQSLGRGGETRALIEAEVARGGAAGDVCARVEALTTAGWLLREIDPAAALRLADQAAGLAVERCPHRLATALINQGWLLAAARRFRDARAVLDRLAALHADDGRVATWTLRLEAEVLLGEDPARAADHARHLAARARALCSSELAYEAHLLRARAEAALGRDASAAFADADRALTLWSRLVPLGEGRATFFERHDQLALTAIPYFLATGARRALAETVRRSLARFTRSLAAGARPVRDERTAVADPSPATGDAVRDRPPDPPGAATPGDAARDRTSRELAGLLARWPAGDAAPGACEARDAADRPDAALGDPRDAIYVHPAGDGWLVIAWRGAAIDVRRVAGPADADRLASAAAAMLAGAPRVQLHVHRAAARLPIDRRLAARLGVPVAFALDAPPVAPASCAARRALVVANPQANLWAASDAAPRIAADLARRGFAVDVLEGAAATRAAVRARLADPCTALFEYDGHAAARSGDRLDDALLLAAGETLTAADVLGLPRAPAQVVLDGCTTAAPEGLGLAQAFVLAGADQVIASLDDVPADAAARFTRALFAGDAPVDLVQHFARAIAEEDQAPMRVYVR